MHGQEVMFNIPLKKVSQNKLINEVEVNWDTFDTKELLLTIKNYEEE